MKKIVGGVVVSLLAAVVAVFSAPSAHAADDPYPDLVCSLSVSDTSVEGGSDVTISVASDVPANLAITFLNETRTRDGATELTETFRTPVVDQRQIAAIVGSCDGIQRSAGLELLPVGADSGLADSDAGQDGLAGILPNTGGIAFWLLLAGLLLALTGAAVVVQRRRA